jgi:hypothetical protein
MDKGHKPNDSGCYTPSSEPFRLKPQCRFIGYVVQESVQRKNDETLLHNTWGLSVMKIIIIIIIFYIYKNVTASLSASGPKS